MLTQRGLMILVVGLPSSGATRARKGDFGFAFHDEEVVVAELMVVLKDRVGSNFLITNGS